MLEYKLHIPFLIFGNISMISHNEEVFALHLLKTLSDVLNLLVCEFPSKF